MGGFIYIEGDVVTMSHRRRKKEEKKKATLAEVEAEEQRLSEAIKPPQVSVIVEKKRGTLVPLLAFALAGFE